MPHISRFIRASPARNHAFSISCYPSAKTRSNTCFHVLHCQISLAGCSPILTYPIYRPMYRLMTNSKGIPAYTSTLLVILAHLGLPVAFLPGFPDLDRLVLFVRVRAFSLVFGDVVVLFVDVVDLGGCACCCVIANLSYSLSAQLIGQIHHGVPRHKRPGI